MSRRIVGDVETTGVSKDDRVVEIAWIELDDDLNVIDTVSSLINPEMPIPPGASAVHHITDKDVANAPTLEQFMRDKQYPLGFGDVCLIAHNAAFDDRWFGLYMPESHTTLCTLRLARRLYPDVDNHKLQTLRYTFGLDGGEAHRAMGDLFPLLSLVKKMMEDTGLDLDGLAALASLPVPISKWPMGKHKGLPLNVDMGYVKWALGPKGMTNMDPDLRAALESL